MLNPSFWISIFATSIFGIVDAMFFLFAEDLLQEKIKKFKFFDGISSELLTGGISASIAIFVSTLIGLQIKKNYNITENPLYDSMGIIVGTFIVLLLYKGFTLTKKSRSLSKNKRNSHIIPKN